LLKYTRIKG